MKWATASGMVRWSGGQILLSAGKTTADDDHPLVRERPDLWTDQQPPADLRGPGAESRPVTQVETATARPGRKR